MVVMTEKEQYLSMAYEHLSNPSTYTLLHSDLTCDIVDKLSSYIIHLVNTGVIDDTTARFLFSSPLTCLQVCYKNLIDLRLIVSGCEGPIES